MKTPDTFPQEQFLRAPRSRLFPSSDQYPPNSNACYHTEDVEPKTYTPLQVFARCAVVAAIALALGYFAASLL